MKKEKAKVHSYTYQEMPTEKELKSFGKLAYIASEDRNFIFTQAYGGAGNQINKELLFVRWNNTQKKLLKSILEYGTDIDVLSSKLNLTPKYLTRKLIKHGINIKDFQRVESEDND